MKKVITFVLVICMAACLASCASSDKKKLVGHWELESGIINVKSMTLSSNGSCSISGEEGGRWSISGNKFEIRGPFGGMFVSHDAFAGTYKLNGDTLTITTEDHNDPFVYKKKE